MAALASHLGVRTPSLYNHVDGQDGLRRELALFGLRELTNRIARAAVGKSTAEALVAVGEGYRDFARQHPGVYAYTLRAPGDDDGAYRDAADEALDVLRATFAGFELDEDDTIHAIRAFRSLLHGFVDLELNSGFGIPIDLNESYRRALAIFIAGLDSTTERHAAAPA